MIAIIDSGGANIASVLFALERLGTDGVLADNPDVIARADRVILPGVGAAKDAMDRLRSKNLIPVIQDLKQPVLGVCLGMQLLFEHSDEGGVDMLGILPGGVQRFDEKKSHIVPHMGWNDITIQADHPLLQGLDNNSYFYFVHSYYAPVEDGALGVCNYGDEFSAIVARDNFMGCQFHPERSGQAGQILLKNFLEMPAC